jgi:hypothetical protein
MKLFITILILIFGFLTLKANAQTVIVEQTAPPVIVETLPAPQPGFVWITGYWGWVGGRHYWYPGRWVPGRRGYWRR